MNWTSRFRLCATLATLLLVLLGGVAPTAAAPSARAPFSRSPTATTDIVVSSYGYDRPSHDAIGRATSPIPRPGTNPPTAAGRRELDPHLGVCPLIGAAEGGSLQIVGSGFSASEQSAAEALAAQGRNVVLREATGVGRTSDLLVDGVPYDVYTPTTGNLDNIVSAIAKKGSQVNGGGVVLDLSQSPLSGVDPAALLARVRGVTPNISNIIIVGG